MPYLTRPLKFAVARGDSPMFPVVMEAVRVPRLGGGRARTRPDAVMGHKAYSSRANRALLRGRRIKAVIPEPSDQIGHRKRRGSLADAL